VLTDAVPTFWLVLSSFTVVRARCTTVLHSAARAAASLGGAFLTLVLAGARPATFHALVYSVVVLTDDRPTVREEMN